VEKGEQLETTLQKNYHDLKVLIVEQVMVEKGCLHEEHEWARIEATSHRRDTHHAQDQLAIDVCGAAEVAKRSNRKASLRRGKLEAAATFTRR